MKVNTRRFGTLTLNTEDIIIFPRGVLGFLDLRRFVILDHKNGPFRWLQSTDDPDVAFVLLDPTLIVDEYSVSLSDRDINQLLLDPQHDDDDLLVMTIANVSTPDTPTLNLLAPICISAQNRRGIQTVQHRSGLSARYPLSQATNRQAA